MISKLDMLAHGNDGDDGSTTLASFVVLQSYGSTPYAAL